MMKKMVKISARKQLETMESVACASGSSNWDEVREQMSEALRQEYGRLVEFDYAPISAKERTKFVAWLEEDEG